MSRRHKRIEGVRRGLRMRSGRRLDRGPRRLERPHTTIGDLTGGRAADLTSFGGGERLKNAMGPWFVATEGGRRRRHKYCPFLEKSFIRLRWKFLEKFLKLWLWISVNFFCRFHNTFVPIPETG
jgi:hypothetical protein